MPFWDPVCGSAFDMSGAMSTGRSSSFPLWNVAPGTDEGDQVRRVDGTPACLCGAVLDAAGGSRCCTTSSKGKPQPRRVIGLKAPKRLPRVLTVAEAQAIVDGCDRLRDRLLFAVV